MPYTPAFFASTANALATRASATSMPKAFAAVSYARFKSASPARMPIASPYTACVVFFPRLYSSLSMAGRSSCTSEYVCIISIAAINGSITALLPPNIW